MARQSRQHDLRSRPLHEMALEEGFPLSIFYVTLKAKLGM